MEKYVCTLCGYVYDPAKGTDDVPPGVSFEDLPEDWVCPECLAEKEVFQSEYQAINNRKPRGN